MVIQTRKVSQGSSWGVGWGVGSFSEKGDNYENEGVDDATGGGKDIRGKIDICFIKFKR
jgi:hypothetical protein